MIAYFQLDRCSCCMLLLLDSNTYRRCDDRRALLTQVGLLGARHGSGCTALPVAGPTGLYSFSVAHRTHRVGLWNILFKRKQRWHNTTFCDITMATGVWNLKQACWLVLPNYVRQLLIGPLVFILLILLLRMVNCHSLEKVFNLFKNSKGNQ